MLCLKLVKDTRVDVTRMLERAMWCHFGNQLVTFDPRVFLRLLGCGAKSPKKKTKTEPFLRSPSQERPGTVSLAQVEAQRETLEDHPYL